jgi:hypothetical protein
MLILRKRLSINAKRALLKGIIISIIVMAAYLVIVVVTTPNLPAITAVKTVFAINPFIIAGTTVGVGAQVAMTSYSKSLGCSLRGRNGLMGAGSGGTAFSSFLSFFSLVPLGCCGSWLLILSLLPSVFGTTVSAVLVQYSIPLSYAGLAIVVAFTSLTAIKLRKELKLRKGGISKFKEDNRIISLSSNSIPEQNKPKRKKKAVLVIGVSAVAAAVLIVMAFLAFNGASSPATDSPGTNNNQIISPSTNDEETKHIVPLDQIVNGGPPRDGIPSIDNPKFVSANDATLQDSDLVLGLNINGDIRAYPLNILVWHEIVNDVVGDIPVAITYCPLCFTNQVFERTIDGQVLEFGTSGKLYNSNLVMYDRASESLWSQALGQAIAGEHAGKKLERIPFDVAIWSEWKTLYPESKVLSQDTGFGRPYGVDPYGNYYTNPDILFPVSHRDDRLGPKEIVVGLENNGIYRAYKLQQIEGSHVINDGIDGKSIALLSLHPFMVRAYDSTIDGQTLEFRYDNEGSITDIQTKSVWNFDGQAIEGAMKGKNLTRLPFDEGFWFEWAAFHPNTELYGRQ